MKAEVASFKLALTGSISARLSAATAARDWRRRWAQIQITAAGLLVAAQEPMTAEAIHARCHALHAFYIQAYHLKDAIIAEQPGGLTGQTVEQAITNSPELALIADLANLDKHVDVNRKPRSGHWPSFGGLAGVGEKGGPGWHLRLDVEHGGKTLDGVEVATRSVQAWRDVMAALGLS